MRPLVVFFAFANDRVEHARYLRNLPEEQRRVRATMAVAEQAGLCEVVERANATADEVLDVFQSPRYRDRVAVFHFGGHAGGAGLLLESTEGRATLAHAGGLSRFLGQQQGLTLVFLNGCSTAGQVQGLLDAGVLAVIATWQVIDDAVATELAARFYQSLASGASLKTSFKEAEAAVRTRVGESARSAYRSFVPEVMDEERWPWDLHVAPGAEERFAQWSLPREARDPLFGLPDLLPMDLPPSSPFKHLDWFTRNDAWIFFGRGREIRDLYEAVTAPDAAPIVLLFGETGVGKSSLLAAGIMPRLEASHEVVYLRRDGTLGLAGTLAGAFGGEGKADKNDLGAAWRAREQARGKPLVVILDQAEEAWTRPLEDKKEKEDLVAALRSIFAVRENRPRGRLILGFRKEWLAEVLRLVDAEALPRTRVEVTHLGRDAIAEVVAGAASTERLRRHYRLEVEPALPEIVADDLSEDSGSAVAPTLQILLSKMWLVASKESPGAPRFTLALYQRLKREGILLDDFLEEQLSRLREWRPDVVASGLALDLLAHHTTSLGTAETRQAADVVERYGGRPEVVELLGQCKDRYLLTDDPLAKNATRLAHDRLAPLVRRRFEISNLSGQRALRVLQQRVMEWAGGQQGPPLDEVDLGIVEQGASGMRAWYPHERRLVEASRREREQRVRRQWALRIGAAVAAAAITASAGVAWWQRGAALESEQSALDTTRLTLAREWLERDPTRAALLLLEVSQPDETAYSVIRLREALGTFLSEAILRGHGGEVSTASFSPDGRLVVTASSDKTSRIWLVDGTGDPVVLRGHQGAVTSASFSPDGKLVVTVSKDSTARVWSADGAGDPVILPGHEGWWVEAAAFSPDGSRIITASGTTAQIWSADGIGKPVILRGHEGLLWSAEFSFDGKRVVTASWDGTARVWSADGVGEPVVLRGHELPVFSASFSHDGRHVVTASMDKTARVWSVDGSGEPVVFRGHESWVRKAVISPDGRRVVTTCDANTVRVWGSDGSSESTELRGHEGSVRSAAFSSDGRRVVTASVDGTARVWSVVGSGEPVVLHGHESWVRKAVFSPDGRRVVTASDDKTARVWQADGSGEPVVLRGHKNSVWMASFSRDGRRVVTASEDTTARVWPADGSGEPVVLRGHKKGLSSAAFSPDGRRVVTASADGTAQVWPADGTSEPVALRGHGGLVRRAVFSSDGKLVVTASWDKTARVWPADGTSAPAVLLVHEADVWSAAFNSDGSHIVTASGTTAQVWSADGTGVPVSLRGHTETVFMAVFSPDGRRVVTASSDGTARVWSVHGSSEPVVFRHEGSVESADFSPDGKRVVTASLDKTARVWLADGTSEPVVLRGHADLVNSAAFNPDGRSVVTASGDGTARIWAVGGILLQALVRSATSACLEPNFRVNYLSEPKVEAQAAYDRCRRCVGPWRREFDARSIRAAPDEAWTKWQACMGR